MEDNFMNKPEDVTKEEQGNPDESKADKFKRIANLRVNNALKSIELIGKLSSSAYEYTPEQIEKIFGALQGMLDSTKEKFTKTEVTTTSFSL